MKPSNRAISLDSIIKTNDKNFNATLNTNNEVNK
jgi:hypothetical protein